VLRQSLPSFPVPVTIPPVKLYHGTTEKIGRLALKEGLRPRVLTGKSNWKHTVESHPSLIYMTSVYAPYYALQAAEDLGKGKIAIVEVDTNLLDVSNFMPDEDFVEQATRLSKKRNAGIKGNTPDNRLKYIRDHLDDFADLWQQSIQFLGTCAYRGTIPKEAITRVAVVHIAKCKVMCFEAGEPVISIMNYNVCAPEFRMLTKWFMGEPVTLEEWLQSQSPNALNFLPETERESARKKIAKALANQKGIQVIRQSPAAVSPSAQR
jgi:hypothetical protein